MGILDFKRIRMEQEYLKRCEQFSTSGSYEITLSDIFNRMERETGLSAKEEQQLKNIDNDLLWYDLKFLLNEEPPQPKPSVCVPIDYTVRPFQEVEDEYRMLFKQLRADIHNSDLLDHD